ncbi:MAG: hypothetical protein RQ885_15370 [Desulfurococcales archaeon]|nr:hypothetical protein [Desulfurococcales archaeon]MDT7890340.1 hypothetical protein [Desulfurococcales archaeon]
MARRKKSNEEYRWVVKPGDRIIVSRTVFCYQSCCLGGVQSIKKIMNI